MAKQLNIGLNFSADISTARQQIQSLITELNKIGSSTNNLNLNMTPQLTEAKLAASQLGQQLNQAFNVDTGKLDLNKLNDGLRKSGMTLTDYGSKLQMLGTQGQQAFQQVASSILQTEMPLRRTNGLLKEFGTTLANTARWQISSSILHGFLSAVQSATGYAKELDKSLNNIRIVTEYNADEMARFAKQANKAAKELSATTTEYTNASLIYYQQGLSAEEVKERTEVTIKMANAAGQSAEVVSDQMTAVWNNFADGTKSLEYYGDVMTALGAATASSTDEIAGGLEKFAAIGETIGLSYEYAASALATITSNTRQSEEVVGTALKTIFARIQGLKLGDTLEDGVDLNKYSEALKKIGVDVLDSTGEMRKMDDILNDMAATWGTLTKAQQAATAQTVAGVRQYTQLVALMENWSDGSSDSMTANLSTSYGSLGTLDKQQKIYEESWEASRDRVKAALEGVYDSLLDENTFININDTLTGVLETVEKLVDSLGGLPGVLSVVSVLMTKIFRDELAGGINNALHNFKNFTGASKAELEGLKQQAYEMAKSLNGGFANAENAAQSTHIQRSYEMQKALEQALIGTNSAQVEAVRNAYQLAQNYADAALNAANMAKESKKAAEETAKAMNASKGSGLSTDMNSLADLATISTGEDLINASKEMQKKALAAGGAGEEITALKAATANYATQSKAFYALPESEQDPNGAAKQALDQAADQVQTAMESLYKAVESNGKVFDTYAQQLEAAGQKIGQAEIDITSIQQTLSDAKDPITMDSAEGQQIQKNIKTAEQLDLPVSDASTALKEFEDVKAKTPEATEQIKAAWEKVIETFKNITITAEQAEEAMEKMAKKNTSEILAAQDSDVEQASAAAVLAQGEADKAQAAVPKKGAGHGQERKNKQAIADKAQAEATEAQTKFENAKKKSMEKTDKVLKKVTKGTEEYTKTIHKNAKNQASATAIDKKAAEQKENLKTSLAAAKKAAQDFGQGATKALSGTSQLSMGIFSLKSAFDALNDPDMSTFDKFTSVLMSVSMGLPSAIGGVKALTSGLKEMVGAMGGSATALLANALGLDANALAESKLNAELLEGLGLKTTDASLTMAEQMSLIKSVALKTLENEAQEESNEEKTKEAGLTLSNIALRTMENMALKGGISGLVAKTAATVGQTLANWGLNASMVPVLAMTIAITLAFVALAAIVAAVAGAIYLMVSAYNADAQAAADAQAQVDSLTTTFEECKAAAEELKASISNWEGGVEALKELDRSTDEYREKLEEVNAQARELIETYGLYDDFHMEDGVITFNEGVLEDLQATADKQANDVETQLQAAKIIANNAKTKSQGTDIGRDIGSLYDASASQMSAQSGGAPVYRTASSSEMQAFANALDSIVQTAGGEELALDVDQVRAALESGISGLPAIIQDNISNLSDDDIQAVIDFRNSMNEATAANRYYAEQVMGNIVADLYADLYKDMATDKETGEVDQGLLNSITNAGTKYANENSVNSKGQSLEEAISAIDTSKATSNNNLNKHYGYDIKNDEDLAKTYAMEVMGWKEEDFSYSGGTNEGTLTNAATGQEIKLDDDLMRKALAREKSVDSVTAEFNTEVQNKMNAFNTAMQNTVSGAKNQSVATTILDAAGSDDKKIDYSELVHQISPSELIKMGEGGMTSEEIMSTLGLSNEDLKAMGLDNGQAFTDGLQEALLTYDPEEFYKNMKEQASASAASQAKEAGFDEEMTEEIKEYSNYIMDMAESSEILDDSLKENAEAAADVATYTARMNRGIDTLADGFEDWNDILKKSDKSSMEYAKALSGMKGALSDILGVEEEYISNDFVTEHMDDIKLAAEGNAEAIDRLAIAAGKDIIVNMEIEGGQAVKDQVLALHDELAAEIPDIKVGATVDDAEFMQKAAQIVEQAGMSVEQANAYFRSMGFEPTFETKTVDVQREVKAIETTTEILEWGSAPGVIAGALNKFPTKIRESSEEVSKGTVTEKMEVPALTTDGGKPNFKLTRTNAGSMNNYSSSNKGGKSPGSGSKSGSEPKKADRKKESEVVERYKEIEDALDDLRDTAEDVNKATDRLYGASRIKQMERNNQMIQEEISLLKKKKEEAQAYLALDRTNLDKAAKEAGIALSYDENGNITNQTTAMNTLLAQYNAAVDAANRDGNADETETKNLEELDKKITNLKDATTQYEETRELIEDLDNEMDDQFYAWQDNNAEILSYKLEIQIELNDDELRQMDYYLNKTEDDFYKRAEAMTIMQDQIGVREKSLATYSGQIAKLDAAYAAGEISQAAYIEGLSQVTDGLYDNLEGLNELDQQMMHYYEDTLTAAQEEIEKTTVQLEKQTAILEHYMNIIDLMGKSTDYEKVGTVLEGQAQTTKNEMIAAREEYEMFAKEKDEMYILWQTAATEEAAELYKKQYEAALAASDEAQEAYLSKAEAYGEALRAILENNLNKYAQDLENALTGGTSFDALTTKMERAASLQEEYLTTTNKIYETNKLINQAQQEIDKSTNSIAKQKLKSFISETDQLQKKNKLSQFELEIQQAKYDLLLAEIALEEAQEAKSQVRLQRDSEGNFGYVYTADQDKIAEAQQSLADAQNALYNISLEGANGYAEKYVQTINALYDTLTDIQQQYLEGAFESEEEYHRAMEDAKAYYYALLEDYSDLYTIAISTDARVLEDSWSREFGSMTYNTEKWKDDVADYVDDVVSAFKQWDTEMDVLASEVGIGGDLSNLSSAVNDITKESENLVDTLTKPGGVLDTIQAEIDAVGDLTSVYANQRAEIQKNIEKYEELIAVINEKKRLEANREEVKNTAASAKPPSSSSGQNSGNKNSNNGNKTGIGNSKYVTVKDGALIYDSKDDTSGESRYFKTGKYEVLQKKDGWVQVHHEDANKGITGWFKESDLIGLASGGYTGEWGPYGKLAMLHEKELVLNKEDTQNLLDTMKLLDNIIQTIDLYTANSQMGGLLNSPAFGNIGSETLEQQVTIEANFPNVSSRTEIEEAFTTLVNRASQYANRK